MSSGGSPANTTNQATTQVQVPDWVQSQLQGNLATANQLASQPYTPSNLPTVAPFSADQTAAFNAIRQNVGSTQPVFDLAQSQVQNLPQTTQSLLNPYLANVEGDTVSNIQRAAALQGQTEASNAIGAGAYGGTREGVQQGVIASEAQRNIGQAINQIQSQGYNTAQNAALSQAAAEGNIASAGQSANLQGISALNQVGQQQQTLQQAQYASALQQWQQAQNYPYQTLALQQSALAGSPYGNTVTSSQPYTSNTAEQLLGLGISAAPLGIMAANYLSGPSTAAAASSLPVAGSLAGASAFQAGIPLAGAAGSSVLPVAAADLGAPAAAGAFGGADAGAAAASAGAAGAAAGKGGADTAMAAAPLLAAA
jgi:hypothetical protein